MTNLQKQLQDTAHRPTTGVTLPFFSYGGSSLVTMMVILAFAEVGIKKPANINRGL